MALPSSGAIDLDQIYNEAVSGGYSGGKDLASLANWNGWLSGPDGILPHEMTEFYGSLIQGVISLQNSPFEYHPDNSFSNTAVSLNASKAINFFSASGLKARVFDLNVATGQISALGPSINLESNSYSHYSIVRLDATHVILFYSQYCKVFEINLSSGGITANQSGFFVFDNLGIGWNSAVLLDSDHVLNFWNAINYTNGNSKDGSCQIFNINKSTGGVSPIGNKFIFNNHLTSVNSAVKVDANHVMNFWYDGGSASAMCQILNYNISTGAISGVGSPFQFDNTTRDNSAFLIDPTHVMIFWNGNGTGYCQILEIDISSGSITPLGVKYSFSNSISSLAFYIDAHKIGNDYVMCAWGDANGGFVQVFQVDTSNGQIIPKTIATIFEDNQPQANGFPADSISSVKIDSSNSMIFWTRRAQNLKGLCQMVNYSI